MATVFSYTINSFLNIIKRSLWDKSLYYEIYSKWKGKGIKYFFTLLFTSAIPYILIMLTICNIINTVLINIVQINEDSNFQTSDNFEYKIASSIHDVLLKFPEIEIKHGKFHLYQEQPVHIKHGPDNETLINIDTRKTHELDEHFPIAVYSDAVVLMGTPHYIIQDLEEHNITKLNYEELIKGIKQLLVVSSSSFLTFMLIIISNIIITGLFRLFINFITITIGCKLFAFHISGSQCLRLAVISLSPAYAIDFIIHLLSFFGILFSKNFLIIVFLITQETAFISLVAIAYSIATIHWIKQQVRIEHNKEM